jgi:flagellar motor protein MotB
MTHATILRRSALLVAVPLLALSGCRSGRGGCSSCAQAPAPAPAPCAPMARMPAPMPAPMPMMAAPAPSPMGEQVRMQQQETIARQKDALEAERRAREATEARLRAAEEALLAAKSEPKGEDAAVKLEQELRGSVVTGAEVLREGSKVVVVLTDAFQPGSDRLKPGTDVKAALLATAAAINRHPDAQVAVLGHSDSTPLVKSVEKWGDNVGLSRARAETVAKALEGEGGVPRDRLSIDGRGEMEPLVAPETTAADRAKNRRVEIQFSY